MLSEFEWTAELEAVLRSLADSLLHQLLPDEVADDARREWFAALVKRGQVVFLCDALDQTRETRGGVFREATWQTLHLEPFDEPRQRRFLGGLADHLLAIKNEKWLDSASYERKQRWADLLEVPLLLHLLRDLAEAGQLENLDNRESVYRHSVRHLMQKGWDTLQETDRRGDLFDLDHVNDVLGDVAWRMVESGNFQGVLQGEPFRKLPDEQQQVLRALDQVDITTLQSVLDDPGRLSLAWRHRSFCEYFGGLRLAELDRKEQEATTRQHARDPNWNWVFRFALLRLQSDGNTDRRDALSRTIASTVGPSASSPTRKMPSTSWPRLPPGAKRWPHRRRMSFFKKAERIAGAGRAQLAAREIGIPSHSPVPAVELSRCTGITCRFTSLLLIEA